MAPPKIKHQVYKHFSGPAILGTIPYQPIYIVGHWEQAFYITASVECNAMMGSLCGYDGTTVTAGLHQAILTYPKALAAENFKAEDDQGSLVDLLCRFQDKIKYFHALGELLEEFKMQGWELSNGKIRYIETKKVAVGTKSVSVKRGDVVFGAELRSILTPPHGRVPNSGPQWVTACDWAVLFYDIFTDHRTFSHQVDFGMEHNLHAAMTRKVNGKTILDYIYEGVALPRPFDVTELDIAMTMYWSHAVNAPAIAHQCLVDAVNMTAYPGLVRSTRDQQIVLAKKLIHLMGTSNWGRWDDDITNGRYQRTRDVMMKSKFWGLDYFKDGGIMPKNLAG